MQVVDFYNRGGDFAKENSDNLAPNIHPLGLTEDQKTDLVEFLLALTDPRVKYEKAPFDHPSITIANGHQVDAWGKLMPDATGKASDIMRAIPAVGAAGGPALGTFLNLDPRCRKDGTLPGCL